MGSEMCIRDRDVAKNLHINIATAGHLISAYALGVCVGAPMLILARKFPLKRILMGLVAIVMIGNICASLAPNYWVMLVARFISGGGFLKSRTCRIRG